MMGERLKRLREKAGMTQTDLAVAAGKSLSIIQKIEASEGALTGTRPTHRAIAEALGMTLDAFDQAVGAPVANKQENGEPSVELLTGANAVSVLHWLAGLDDDARREVVNQVDEGDARMLIWSLSERIRPLSVKVRRTAAGESKDAAAKGTHAPAQP